MEMFSSLAKSAYTTRPPYRAFDKPKSHKPQPHRALRHQQHHHHRRRRRRCTTQHNAQPRKRIRAFPHSKPQDKNSAYPHHTPSLQAHSRDILKERHDTAGIFTDPSVRSCTSPPASQPAEQSRRVYCASLHKRRPFSSPHLCMSPLALRILSGREYVCASRCARDAAAATMMLDA